MDDPTPRFVTFTVWGDPRAKPRPRLVQRPSGSKCRICGVAPTRPHVYVEDWQRELERQTRQAFRAEYGADFEPMTGPLRLVVWGFWPCPKGDERVREKQPLRWRDKRPDASNLVRIYEDAMSGLVFADDAQVCDSRSMTFVAPQGKAARTLIAVAQLGQADLDVLGGLAPEELVGAMNQEAGEQLAFGWGGGA